MKVTMLWLTLGVLINVASMHKSTTNEGLNLGSHRYHDVHKFLPLVFTYCGQNYAVQLHNHTIP